MSKRLELTGKKFGRWTVLGFAYVKSKKTYWECLCDCGNKCVIVVCSLTGGKTKSCGCFQKRFPSNLRHGMCGTKFYNIWMNMKARCLNKDYYKYHRYGGRGIKICDRWLKSFKNFKDDMYKSYLEHSNKYSEKDTTIERVNNDGNYCPENCSFANFTEQANNRSSNCLLTFNGQAMNITQWAKKLNFNIGTLNDRINSGWSTEKALTIQTRKMKKRHT